ncbi:DNA internalization-related competence protein ComEC/Rec2 [Saccharophagus degradans]|uniref:DNA internalization-related competence protein ComEC/Rec2 n=1 Tax=Saccharophagus degradans (strain 2-40 / ATCC 43961 / DSM 17024) TaxID=203122 RepID=Q21K17_SACD2|nr:DNA internalization-related competence protein ComEC/Rec2 [Saccharophagus degradans]ABD80962.1 DNA internalization-related competence protein ComEC/Rec2 [Saccharophagus degradans 2-40]
MPNSLLLCFLIPLGAVVWLPSAPCSLSTAVIVILSLVGLYLFLHFLRYLQSVRIVIAMLLAALLGVSMGVARISHVVNAQLPVELELQDLNVHFEVASLPQVGALSTRFIAKPVSIACTETVSLAQPLKCKALTPWRESIRLSWYGAPALEVGQQWQVTVRLRKPRGLVNTDGFDYHAWLLQQGIMATGYVRTKDKVVNVSQLASGLATFEARRQWLDNAFTKAENKLRHHDLMRALAYGDKSHINTARWAVLNKSGTVHLMAISGLHIGLIATLGWWFGFGLLKASARLHRSSYFVLALPFIFSILFSFFYAGLAGFAVPTMRALIMVVAVNFALITGKYFSGVRILIIAAIVVVLVDPFAFLSAGFWLSFGAVACLFFSFTAKPAAFATNVETTKAFASASKILRGAKALMLMQWQLFVGLFVLLIVLGQQISWVSPFANVVAVPVVSILVVPLVLLASVLFSIWEWGALGCLQVADTLLAIVLWWLNWVVDIQNTLPVFNLSLSTPAKWLAFFATVLILLPRALACRALGVAIAVCVFFDQSSKPDKFVVTVLDVGQGLSVLVESPSANFLYDAGAAFSDDFDMGSRVVYPVIKSKGIPQLDAVFVSHSDNDHAGGVGPLLNLMPASKVIASALGLEKTTHLINQTALLNTPLATCAAGEHWQLGELSVSPIWPPSMPALIPSFVKQDINNQSCVLLVTFQNRKILLPGDIDKTVERHLIASGLLPTKVDLLVAAHHGSKTSSSKEFIDTVNASYVVYSAGYKNRYHHPSAVVAKRFDKAGAITFNTALDGAVEFVFTAAASEIDEVRERVVLMEEEKGDQVRVNTARSSRKRLWF